MFDTVVAAKEMTADKVEGAGKEIDITIKRGIMPSIKVPHEESSDLVSHEVTEQFHVYNIYFSGRVIWPMEAFMICNSVIFLFSGSKKQILVSLVNPQEKHFLIVYIVNTLS